MLDILKKLGLGILTWTRGPNHDHEGGSSRARLLHCTKERLTPAISPNVGNSTSSFLLVGICVRANPFNSTDSLYVISFEYRERGGKILREIQAKRGEICQEGENLKGERI